MTDTNDQVPGDAQASGPDVIPAPETPPVLPPPAPPAPPAPPTPAPQVGQAPPPYLPPLAAFAPPQAPAKEPGGFKRGFGTGFGFGTAMIVFGVVMSLVGGLMMIGAAAALGGAATAATAVDRTVTLWGNANATPANTIRAISISGAIQTSGSDGLGLSAMTYGYEVASILDSLRAEDAAGVVLLMNTPGGTITGSKAIVDAVDRYKKRTSKKVVAFVQGMSASGGMYAMAGADEIIADHGTLIGSIGVIFGPFERYKDVVGISGTLLTPGVTTTGGITQEYLTQGKGKDFGNPFRDMTAEERSKLMVGLEKEYNAFVGWVSQARGIPVDTIKNDIGAYIYDGDTAVQLKLIDKVMNRDDAFREAAKTMSIDPDAARIVAPRPPTMLESILGSEQRVFGQSAPIEAGKQVRVTSVLCTGAPQTMVYYGPLTSVCG